MWYLNGKMEGCGFGDAINWVDVAAFLREDVFEDVCRSMAYAKVDEFEVRHDKTRARTHALCRAEFIESEED